MVGPEAPLSSHVCGCIYIGLACLGRSLSGSGCLQADGVRNKGKNPFTDVGQQTSRKCSEELKASNKEPKRNEGDSSMRPLFGYRIQQSGPAIRRQV